jgi:uncharacterized protein with HEPN domain
MPRDWKMRIQDMLDAIAKIQSYTAGMDYSTFQADEKTVDAVVRNFQIMGEAARYIPADIEARWPQLPWADMRDMRNVVIHEYFGVSRAILWQTIVDNLPPLPAVLQQVLFSS